MSRKSRSGLFKARALKFWQVEATDEPIVVTDHGETKLEVLRYHPPGQNPLDRLRGTVLRYDDPLEPVGEEDWVETP